MRFKNTEQSYGLVSILIHWVVALVIFGMFTLGVWMVDLGYYHPWYHKAPTLHKAVGILVFVTLLFRLLWRFTTLHPKPVAQHTAWLQFAAKAGHFIIYALTFVILISGYLISTAEGAGISVFGLFDVPALIQGLPNQADIAGDIHKYAAWALIFVVIGHAFAALKHHFFDKQDPTLVRMFGRSSRKN